MTDEQQRLYAAYSRAYEIEVRAAVTSTAINAAFIAMAVYAATVGVSDKVGLVVAVAALTWLVVRRSGVLPSAGEHRRTAVNIQEQFDLTFWKPDGSNEVWNHLLLGDPVVGEDIRERSHEHTGKPLDPDYWVDTTGLRPNTGALLRIDQSASWGRKTHAQYALVCRGAALAAGVVLGLAVFAADLTATQIVPVLAAAAPAISDMIAAADAHRELARRRGSLSRHCRSTLEGMVDSPGEPETHVVRSAQDELVRLRLADRRIPQTVYRRGQARWQLAIDLQIEQLARRLGRQSADPQSVVRSSSGSLCS